VGDRARASACRREQQGRHVVAVDDLDETLA
jgi:hypothetical protein